MKIILQSLFVCLALSSGMASAADAQPQRSPDKVLLDRLESSGSDLSRLHRFEFALHFPTQKEAERAASKLVPLAFETKTARGSTGAEWVVSGWKRLYPIESDLSGLRDKLNAVAAQEHGSYDGWTAKVVN